MYMGRIEYRIELKEQHMHSLYRMLVAALCFVSITTPLHAQSVPESLLGDWSLEIESGVPAWMSIQEKAGKPIVYMRLYIGSAGPYEDVEIVDGRLKFELKKRKKKDDGVTHIVYVGIKDGKLDGTLMRIYPAGSADRVMFAGKKIPPMPTSPPDLSQVKFGEPIALFNGKDLSGWVPHEPEKIIGWAAKDGWLVNSTPKTDFSATGDHANLKTEAVFDDFKLHIEFLIGSQRNSGIYLRGMYEAQVVDRDSRMQGLQGVGAIFGAIAPSMNAGKPGGEWQTYDITLVDRHVTVVLNGEKVIDNQPILGPTAGAIHTNPAAPGPIYLQGDHTSVSYRNIYLMPVLK
jgi:hypothetical protein